MGRSEDTWKHAANRGRVQTQAAGSGEKMTTVKAYRTIYPVNYGKRMAEAHRVCNVTFTLRPYFFSSSLARNLHPHQNLGLVALKTHWPRVGLYASCDNKKQQSSQTNRLRDVSPRMSSWLSLGREHPNPPFHSKLWTGGGASVRTTGWRLK